MKCTAQWLLYIAGLSAIPLAQAQPLSPSMQQAIVTSAEPSTYLRSTLPGMHEWLKELERNGIVDRSLPRPYRIALPIAQWGHGGPSLKITYTALPGRGEDKGILLFVHIPLR